MVHLFILAINVLFAYISFVLYELGRSSSRSGWKWLGLSPAVITITADITIARFWVGENSFSLMFQWVSVFIIFFVSLHYWKLKKIKERYELHIEHLELENEGAETETLKLQLDPHFLFNSLNTLHHLIARQNGAARDYVQLLSEVYRYILHNRNKELVLLDDELAFSKQYFDLLSIRYGSEVQFKVGDHSITTEQYLVIPVSIQILIENVFKHNHFSSDEPLLISVLLEEKYVSVHNKIRKTDECPSFSIGLQNLSERSMFITGKPLEIVSSPSYFQVRIPLIKFK